MNSFFSIEYSEKSLKFLQHLNIKDSLIIFKKIEKLKQNPLHYIEKLTGIELWKLRVGNYRAIIKLDRNKQIIYIVDIGNRRDIYKNI